MKTKANLNGVTV
jgi:hypothetical protein